MLACFIWHHPPVGVDSADKSGSGEKSEAGSRRASKAQSQASEREEPKSPLGGFAALKAQMDKDDERKKDMEAKRDTSISLLSTTQEKWKATKNRVTVLLKQEMEQSA